MSIPDDVIEAMARGMFGQDWACGAPELEGFRKALAAAEAKGWKLVPREPTEEMLANTVDTKGTMRLLEFTTPDERSKPFLISRYAHRAMWDAAPSVKP